MQTDELLELTQYSLEPADKDRILCEGLGKLTELHCKRCPEYARVLSVFYPDVREIERPADAPWLPVSLFKTHALRSIPEDSVFKTLTSSGTTSGAVSRIFLDAESAARQTRALASIGLRPRPSAPADDHRRQAIGGPRSAHILRAWRGRCRHVDLRASPLLRAR